MIDAVIVPLGGYTGYIKWTKRFGGCYIARLVGREAGQELAVAHHVTQDAARDWLQWQVDGARPQQKQAVRPYADDEGTP